MPVSAAEFEVIVHAAFDQLPDAFRAACEDLAIRVEAFADEETLAALELENPYELLGLYHGINLARKSVLDLPGSPDMVLLYRMPIIAYAAASDLPLENVVRHVLVHEIGHHFGFSDADMAAIEAADGAAD